MHKPAFFSNGQQGANPLVSHLITLLLTQFIDSVNTFLMGLWSQFVVPPTRFLLESKEEYLSVPFLEWGESGPGDSQTDWGRHSQGFGCFTNLLWWRKNECKFVNLPTNLHSYPHLWPQAGGSDRKLSKWAEMSFLQKVITLAVGWGVQSFRWSLEYSSWVRHLRHVLPEGGPRADPGHIGEIAGDGRMDGWSAI